MELGILGGGLSGLSLAFFYGGECEVLEKEPEAGGLCRSVTRGDYTYDYGGHIIFSRDEGMLRFMTELLGDNRKRYRRNNKIWFKQRFVKYPFENGLGDLPAVDRFACLFHYLFRPVAAPANFREWCYHRFGRGIADRYLVPYNEKIWNIPTEQLGLEWIGGRVPQPPLKDVVKSALGIETEGYTHQLYFYYPRRGGIESLIRALSANTPAIETDFPIRLIGGSNGGWVVSDGVREKRYNRLVSTIPLPELISALEDVPQEVRDAARNLRYNSLVCVMIAARSERPSEQFAGYFPQRELFFHRVCWYDYFGASCVPAGHSLLVAEITVNRGDGICERRDDELVERVRDDLTREGLVNREDIVATDVARQQYAYVVNDLDYAKNLGIVRDFVGKRGIILCGRFAEWKYMNMDACIASAMRVNGMLSSRSS